MCWLLTPKTLKNHQTLSAFSDQKIPNPMKLLIPIVLASALLSSCGTSYRERNAPWAKAIEQEVKKMGTANWIVVAEPAFPSLSRKGVTTITTPAGTATALDVVLQSRDSQGHAKPYVYVTRESKMLSERYAPGVNGFNKRLKEVLRGREARELDSAALELLVKDAQKNYRILVIKSQTTLPYTSVFIELDTGYWDGEAETALRKQLKR